MISGRPADVRVDQHLDHQAAAARFLWSRLPRSGTLMLGPGRTGAALAAAMIAAPPSGGELTVITNSLDIASVLSPLRELSVYSLGGRVSQARVQEGAWAIEELQRLRVDVSVITPDGIDPDGGLTFDTTDAAALGQAQLAAATRTIAMADPVTLGRTGFVRFAGAEALTELVISSGLDPAYDPVLIGLGALGVTLTRAT